MESVHGYQLDNSTRLFYVKFRGKSFRESAWLKEEEILTMDLQSKAKLN